MYAGHFLFPAIPSFCFHPSLRSSPLFMEDAHLSRRLLKLGLLFWLPSASSTPRLLALIRVAVCTLHSQDSLLPLCGQTFMPAAVSKPPLPHVSASLLSTPDPKRLPHAGCGSSPGRISLPFFNFLFNSFAAAFFSITRAQTTENKHRR